MQMTLAALLHPAQGQEKQEWGKAITWWCMSHAMAADVTNSTLYNSWVFRANERCEELEFPIY